LVKINPRVKIRLPESQFQRYAILSHAKPGAGHCKSYQAPRCCAGRARSNLQGKKRIGQKRQIKQRYRTFDATANTIKTINALTETNSGSPSMASPAGKRGAFYGAVMAGSGQMVRRAALALLHLIAFCGGAGHAPDMLALCQP
jgi:hypothetical protein